MVSTKWGQIAVALLFVLLFTTGCGGANPQPGAVFAGPMEPGTAGDNASIEGGELEFTIAENGEGIATLTYALGGSTCIPKEGVVMEGGDRSSTVEATQPFPIQGGSFEVDMGDIILKGKFNSPTEASGTMEVSITSVDSILGSFTCDYGTLNWSAQMK